MLILGNYYRQQFGCVARSEWMTEELELRTVYYSSYYMTRKNDEEITGALQWVSSLFNTCILRR